MDDGVAAAGALTERNLHSLLAADSSRGPLVRGQSRTVLDYLAEQATLIAHPDSGEGRRTPEYCAGIEKDQAKDAAAAGAERQCTSPFMEPRLRAKQHEETLKDRGAAEARADGRADAPGASSKTARSKRDLDREQREAEERLTQRRQRRRDKALIVQDRSKTAAQKFKERNAKERKKRKRALRSDSVSSLGYATSDEEACPKREKKKRKSTRRDEDEEFRSTKTTRKSRASLAAMEALDRPKSIQQAQRLTLAPTLGVFKKGVASVRTRNSSSNSRPKVPTSDLVFSELKFLAKEASGSSLCEEDNCSSNSIGENSYGGSNAGRRARVSKSKPAEHQSSRFFKRSVNLAGSKTTTFRTSGDSPKNFPAPAIDNDDLDLDAGFSDEEQPAPRRHQYQQEPASEGDAQLSENGQQPLELSDIGTAEAEERRRGSTGPNQLAESDHQAAFGNHRYLTEIPSPEPANAWRRNHSATKSTHFHSHFPPPPPRLYSRHLAQGASGKDEGLALRGPFLEHKLAMRGAEISTEQGTMPVKEPRRVPLSESFRFNRSDSPYEQLTQENEIELSADAYNFENRPSETSHHEPHVPFGWDDVDAAYDNGYYIEDRLGQDQCALALDAARSRETLATAPQDARHAQAENLDLMPSQPSWCIREPTPLGELLLSLPSHSQRGAVTPAASAPPLSLPERNVADGEIMGLAASQLTSFWEPFRT